MNAGSSPVLTPAPAAIAGGASFTGDDAAVGYTSGAGTSDGGDDSRARSDMRTG